MTSEVIRELRSEQGVLEIHHKHIPKVQFRGQHVRAEENINSCIQGLTRLTGLLMLLFIKETRPLTRSLRTDRDRLVRERLIHGQPIGCLGQNQLK